MANLYRVIKRSHINEILEDNLNKIVVLMLTSKINNTYTSLKQLIKEMSSTNKDDQFIFVDFTEFDGTINEFKKDDKKNVIPITIFYWDNEEIAYVKGSNINDITNTYKHLKEKIKEKISSYNGAEIEIDEEEEETINKNKNTHNTNTKQNNKEDNLQTKNMNQLTQILALQQLQKIQQKKEQDNNLSK